MKTIINHQKPNSTKHIFATTHTMDMSSSQNKNNSESSDANRESESPARTIDSHDSTSGSMDTIVDRAVSQQHNQQQTIEQSMNTTNMQQHSHNSLTNSEIAILQQQSTSASDDEHQHLSSNGSSSPANKQQQAQRPMDAQSHIYSSPVYDEKPMAPLKLTAANLVDSIKMPNSQQDDLKKPKLITHNEFKQQLQNTLASRAATLESRISKKQRFPPELIKDDGSSVKSSKSLKKKQSSAAKNASSTACCTAFPVQIVLGLLQLILSICLVALGSLLIVREAALSTAGCGIWTGLIAAVTGALGVVGLRKTQTSFLALSLVCIATSTLGIAISGVGLSRDVNRSEEKVGSWEILKFNN